MEERNIVEVIAEAMDAIEQPKLNAVNPHFKNKYADLSELLRVVNAACRGKGLWVHHDVKWTDNQPTGVCTVIEHGTQRVETALVPVPLMGKPQEVGSAITYAKRYSLAMAFGLAADEDDDGEEAQKARYQPKRVWLSDAERVEKGIKALMGVSVWTRETLAPILEPLSDADKVKWLADAYKEAKRQLEEQQG